MSVCPICNRSPATRAENKAFPFCSPRCKTIDLGQWFDEKYRIPVSETANALDEGQDESAKR
jgi:endogenous inhibitor of DNA gyrase (YacG/DUF329 family)